MAMREDRKSTELLAPRFGRLAGMLTMALSLAGAAGAVVYMAVSGSLAAEVMASLTAKVVLLGVVFF
ncbi:MAG: hypothetical protein KAU28_11015, partial [Phycisphaerae bacterium]|nr:hypothetical protein [Phycisphaerae bacterium]